MQFQDLHFTGEVTLVGYETLEINLNILVDPKTKAQHIIPDEDEISKGIEETKKSHEETIEKLKAKGEVENLDLIVKQSEEAVAVLVKRQQIYDKLRPQSTRVKYVVKLPTTGEFIEAESACTQLIDKQISVDHLKLMLKLVEFVGMTDEEVSRVRPNVILYIWGMIKQSMDPDPERLSFFL